MFPSTSEFPISNLPPTIREAVRAVHDITKAPISLIVSSALGASATACQGLADVQRPSIPGTIPISLNFLIIADSGERKSAVDAFFFAPIHVFEKAKRADYEQRRRAYALDRKIQQAKEHGLKRRIACTVAQGQSTEGLERELRALCDKSTLEPSQKRIALSDITPAALAAELAKNPCTAVLHSNEAADVLRRCAIGNLAFLNRAWDGQNIEIDRRDTKQSLVVEGARLSTVLAIQAEIFNLACEGSDSNLRGSGYLARALITHPPSTAGSREIDIHGDASSLPIGVLNFQNFVTNLLGRSFDRHAQEAPRSVMKFTSQAKRRWGVFFNFIEVNLGADGGLLAVKDFSAKAAEHVTRIAAIFEIFTSDSHEISMKSTEDAIAVVSWYLREFDNILGGGVSHRRIERNANALLAWIRKKSASHFGEAIFQRRKIMQFGPRGTRNAEDLDQSLDYLVERGYLCYTDLERKGVVLIRPAHSSWIGFHVGNSVGNGFPFGGERGLLPGDCAGVMTTHPYKSPI